MNKKQLRECLRIAADFHRKNKHPLMDTFSHYSFIFQDNSMLGWGINVNAIPPIHFGYGQRMKNFNNDNFLPKVHAELMAYNRVKGILNHHKEWQCFNIRLNKACETKISCPCSTCSGWMKELGCREVIFTLDNNQTAKIKFN